MLNPCYYGWYLAFTRRVKPGRSYCQQRGCVRSTKLSKIIFEQYYLILYIFTSLMLTYMLVFSNVIYFYMKFHYHFLQKVIQLNTIIMLRDNLWLLRLRYLHVDWPWWKCSSAQIMTENNNPPLKWTQIIYHNYFIVIK